MASKPEFIRQYVPKKKKTSKTPRRRVPKEIREALEQFREVVCTRSKKVDPGEEQDWYSLSLGFFLCAGLSINQSYKAARIARYDYGYWQREGEIL